MNIESLLIWHSACATDTGKVRKINEDACLDLPELGLWVVADGMGGHAAGDVASQMIVDSCQQINEPQNLDSFVSDVQQCLQLVNRNLIEMAAQKYDNETIGSTVVALLAYNRQCACLWVGDSRIYRLRNNILEQMTRDHSMVEEYIDEGFMSQEQAYSSNMSNVLTRAIGAEDELVIDVKMSDLQNGDTFLLCSDGLYREVTIPAITQIMSDNDDCGSISKKLIETALENAARDNVTVGVIQIMDT